jgi:hypothetical protein
MDMLRVPLPYGDVSGAVMDFTRAREDPGGEVPYLQAGLREGNEAPLQDADVGPLETRRRPQRPSDRVLRSARPIVESAYTAATVGDFLDMYGAFLFEIHAALSVSKTTERYSRRPVITGATPLGGR